MKRTVLVAVAAVALVLAAGATAYAADPTPIPGTLTLRLSPAPVNLDSGQRTVTLTNHSDGRTLAVTLTPSGGYAVEPATLTLAPGESADVTLTAVDPTRDGTLTAYAEATVTGTVRSAISLDLPLRHQTWLEQHSDLAPLAVLAVGLALLVTVRLSRRAR